jgi:hypothetical protein
VEALDGAPGCFLPDMQVNNAVLTIWINYCKPYLINPIEMPNSNGSYFESKWKTSFTGLASGEITLTKGKEGFAT